MINLEDLKRKFNKIDFREKRPGIFKVLLPFFHEDGDMYDIFIEEIESQIRISDYGLTLMKLSYAFDIDSEHKREVLESIILQNRCMFKDGVIYLDVTPEQFEGGVYQFTQTISKVLTMDIISKENVKSYFYELLNDFMFDKFKKYNIQKNFAPLPDSELTVDYLIPAPKPIFLFAIKDDSKASKVIITCLNFINQNVRHRSLIINDNFQSLSRFNQNQIINTVDKQFAQLEDFKEQGEAYLQRELA